MRVKILFTFVLIHLYFIICGQIRYERNKINVDSLKHALPAIDDHNKVDAFNKIALARFGYTTDSIFTLSRKAIKIADRIGYQKGKADGYFNMGNAYYMQDDIREAVKHYLNALSIYENIDPTSELWMTYYALSVINWQAGRSTQAISYARKETSVQKQLGDYQLMIVGKFVTAAYYAGIQKTDSAEHYYTTAIRLLEDHPDTSHLIMEYNHLARLMITKANLDTSFREVYYKKCIVLCNKVLKLLDLFEFNANATAKYSTDAYYKMAYCYLNGMDGDSVLKGFQCIEKAIETSYRQGLFLGLVRTYNLLGNYYLNNNKIYKAIEYYLMAIDSSELRRKDFSLNKFYINDPYDYKYTTQYVYKNALQHPCKNLYNCYLKLEDYKNALKYYILWRQIINEVFLLDNNNLIATLEAESENEKNIGIINTLERDREISDLRATQARNLNMGIGGLSILLIVVGFLFFRQNKLRNEHKNTLLQQKLLRLQMNPHFIFNALSNIMHAIEDNKKQIALSYLSKFSKLLRTNLESSREEYILLEDEISSIEHYLELQNLRYENKFEYTIQTGKDIDIESAIIPPMLIQPFIENAIEHGIRHKQEKGHIIIRFKRNNENISCEIEDNGVGRKKAWETEYRYREHRSLATDIIRDRLAVLNKKLKKKISLSIIDLKSDTDEAQGTLVRLDFPYLLD